MFLASSDLLSDAAIKFVPKVEGAERELLLADLPGSEYVLPVVDKGEWGDYLVLVMPRAEKSLRDALEEAGGALDLESSLRVLHDIASGLASIADAAVHRDLKPENVLLHDGKWKLADFGIARYADATTAVDTRKFAMTPPYAAPEQWRQDRATTATDVYALGVIAHEVLAGTRPFPGPGVVDLRDQHLHQVPPSLPVGPMALQNLVAECLYKAPPARPNPENVLARLDTAVADASKALLDLQAVNRVAVSEKAAAARAASVEQTARERRLELARAGNQALERIQARFTALIEQGASEASLRHHQRGIGFRARLRSAALELVPPENAPSSENIQFDVVLAAQIELRFPRKYDWDGRSHALWLCDPKNTGRYRWYEIAFMMSPLTGKRAYVNPFALPPTDEAARAIDPIMSSMQVAWPFTAVDQGEEEPFIER